MRLRRWMFVLIATVAVRGPTVWAEPVLMSLDGASSSNIDKAGELGHTVDTAFLTDIRDMSGLG